MMDIPFMLYAMECEGDLSTRQGKINKLIKILAESSSPNDPAVQSYAYKKVNLDSDTLTDEEVSFIQGEVRRRILNKW